MKKTNIEHTCEPLHTVKKFGQPATTTYLSQLDNLQVKLISPPTEEQFKSIIAIFMKNTWKDKLDHGPYSEDDVDQTIKELFKGEILPTGMECPNITWTVEGLDMIDTTHLIRHRLFSFSAQTHADRDMRHDSAMVKPGIMIDTAFFARYISICDQAKALYTDMMDSGRVNCLDARTIMPRCFEHFYIVRSTIKDIISFCIMRADEQIQTQSDNIIALKLWLEILKQYPFLGGLIDFSKPDGFYIKQSKKGKTNIFPPNAKNDLFDWSPKQFFHDKHRDDFPGGSIYLDIRDNLIEQINAYKSVGLFNDE